MTDTESDRWFLKKGGFAPFPLVEDGYEVLLVDPPWSFKTYSAKGEQKSAKRHYPTMALDEIKRLPVGSLAAQDAILLLWTTWPHLEQAMGVMREWGFPYSTGLPWIKRRSDRSPRLIMGYYWRHATEVLLLGKRGKALARADRGVPGLLDTVAPAEHSRKPPEQYAMIDRLWPNTRRIELFARPPHRPGWTVWGRDADAR